MKAKVFSFFVICSLFSFSVEAKETPKKARHFYVSPNDVKIVQSGIFVRLNGTLVRVDAVSFDQNGLFVKGLQVEKNLHECRGCGYVYHSEKSHPKCPQCGRQNN